MSTIHYDTKLMMTQITRRQFLQSTAGSAIFFLAGCRAQPAEGLPDNAAATAVADPIGDAPLDSRELILTPNDRFYVMAANGTPTIAIENWSLQIDGLVENPLTLRFADLETRPFVEMMRTLECIGNVAGGNQIGNAVWGGIWLNDLLQEAKILAKTKRAKITAADGYETSVSLERILQPGALLAYRMNGEPLPPEHGHPLRLFLPGLYGQKMPKWITRIEFIDNQFHLGTWEKEGWSNEAIVKTNSHIMLPEHQQKLPLAKMEIFGLAYAGDRHITQVEIGIESGKSLTWLPAEELLRGPSDEVWTQFYLSWTPPSFGTYTLLVRATDDTGFVQTQRAGSLFRGAFPDGSDKIHHLKIEVG